MPDPPVHPRTHGEHPWGKTASRSPSGSSPHTRGTSCLQGKTSAIERFIPAHTGNIRAETDQGISESVHPRTHGEHDLRSQLSGSWTGSSPHTRGTFIELLEHDLPERFIPAHTGNMLDYSACYAPLPVHPRTHGEHVRYDRPGTFFYGSSPHTRGTSVRDRDIGIGIRFIPAHTGNIRNCGENYLNQTVHPRTHGEHKIGV